MKKHFLLILVVLILISCSKVNRNLVGYYKSSQTTTSLVLNPDSSYTFTTCGNIITGHWTKDQDSVYLQMETNIWRNDSLQEVGFKGTWPEVYEKPYGLKIKGSQLIEEYYIIDSIQTKIRRFERYKKTNPPN